MRHLLQAFDEKDDFEHILQKDLKGEGIHVHIGRENEIRDLEDLSVVVKDYYLGQNPIGGVAVVGPTRMKYAKVVAVVSFVADSVTETMKRF
jgi:heat-inducible transcriptional repressor